VMIPGLAGTTGSAYSGCTGIGPTCGGIWDMDGMITHVVE
jgi:hypothetical protein